jgi:hypothetical protein
LFSMPLEKLLKRTPNFLRWRPFPFSPAFA